MIVVIRNLKKIKVKNICSNLAAERAWSISLVTCVPCIHTGQLAHSASMHTTARCLYSSVIDTHESRTMVCIHDIFPLV